MATFGNACTSRSSAGTVAGTTFFDTTNPSPSNGTLTSACFRCNFIVGSPVWKVKIFRLSGSNYNFVAESGTQALSVGSNTISGLSIDILVGDYIGFYVTGGTADISLDNGVGGIKFLTGDVTTNTPTSSWGTASQTLSILGTFSVILTNVYVNSSTGNDANGGTSCVDAVKTFTVTYSLCKTDGSSTIYVCNSGADFSGETITFTKGFSITTSAATGNFFMPVFT